MGVEMQGLEKWFWDTKLAIVSILWGRRSTSGQGTTEYAILVGVLVVIAIIAIVAFALNFASAAGGVFKTSVESVPHGQTEAGLALGF